MRPQHGGGRPTRRAAQPHARDRANPGGTKAQRIRRDLPDDDSIEAGRYRSRHERNFELPRSVVEALRQATDAKQAPFLERRLVNAAQAYERDRYKEALQNIKPVVDAAPEVDAARELYGLTLYRLGRWRQAAKELSIVAENTASFDQYPVIADCERALGHFDRVTELWNALRREGVDKDVLVEGRLVMAGAMADADDLDGAIELLATTGKNRRSADVPLLRQWYALANFYELAGDLPRARELFARVAQQAPDLLDAPERLRAIR